MRKLLLCTILCLGISMAAGAAETAEKLDPLDPNVIEVNGQLFKMAPPAAGYNRPTPKNTAQSLWALKMFGVEDSQALDDFIYTQNCNLYSQYQQNDFLWKRIREASLRDMDVFSKTWPVRYEIASSLLLDRYDFNLGGFALNPQSTLDKTGVLSLINVKALRNVDACFDANRLKDQPTDIRVKLDNPITLKVIPMQQVDADALVKYLTEKNNKDRQISMVLRVRLTGIDNAFDQRRLASEAGVRQLTGRIESLSLFRDNELKEEVYTQKFDAK